MTGKEKGDIRTSVNMIGVHIDLIRQELAELESHGIRVDFVSIKGTHDEFQAEHAEIRLLDGMMSKAAEALGEQMRPWSTITPYEKQIVLQDMTIRGHQV